MASRSRGPSPTRASTQSTIASTPVAWRKARWHKAPEQAPRWSVLFLRDPRERAEAPRVAHRVEVTKEIVSRSGYNGITSSFDTSFGGNGGPGWDCA